MDYLPASVQVVRQGPAKLSYVRYIKALRFVVVKLKILVLCTGNSCRSQMAEGLLKSFDPRIEAHSAGTKPADQVNPHATRAMKEIGLDISGSHPKTVDGFLNEEIDYVITVCGDADENCPVFQGSVGRRMHIGFPDPAEATGAEEEILGVFRQSRDDIKAKFHALYESELKPQLDAAACRSF